MYDSLLSRFSRNLDDKFKTRLQNNLYKRQFLFLICKIVKSIYIQGNLDTTVPVYKGDILKEVEYFEEFLFSKPTERPIVTPEEINSKYNLMDQPPGNRVYQRLQFECFSVLLFSHGFLYDSDPYCYFEVSFAFPDLLISLLNINYKINNCLMENSQNVLEFISFFTSYLSLFDFIEAVHSPECEALINILAAQILRAVKHEPFLNI